MNKKILTAALSIAVLISSPVHARLLDQIVAVVEDDVILEGELEREVATITQRLTSNRVSMPPEAVLKRQVLERMIVDKLQRQMAARSGIQVTDEMLRHAINEISSRNNLNDEQFRAELEKQGMDYKSFEDNVRNEIILNQLKVREIGAKIKVTDAEVSHYLETQSKSGQSGNIKYRLGHILIAVPEQASAAEIKKAQEKVDKALADLRAGKDFKQVAISVSNDANALKGGDLGWRSLSEIPTPFVADVQKMHQGDISEPIRSPSGFHIIKMLDTEDSAHHIVTKTKVRHILIKTNELIDDNEAKKRLLALKQRIADGDDFATLAKAHSDDKGSAMNGGSLDWVTPGALVPPFEEAMNKLAPNAISEPIQTQFGWHIIQVLERQDQDNSAEFRKDRVKEEIRKRKIEEETELWLRRLRDEAYVEINQDRL